MMPRLLRSLVLFALLAASGARVVAAESAAPAATVDRVTAWILTWRHDRATTQVIDWHQEGPAAATPVAFAWRKVGAESWTSRSPDETLPFPFSERRIHRLELTGLAPDTLYEFRLGELEPLRFRTLPATLTRPLTFAAGGDIMGDPKICEKLNRVVAARDAAFVIWGGDHAYANGLPENVVRWYRYFDLLSQNLLAADRRVLPLVVSIGNHEIVGGAYDKSAYGREGWPATDAAREQISPYFFRLFAFPGHPGYGVLDLGDYASFVVLDTEHAGPMAGAQTEWLAATLRARPRTPFVMPLYHVPGYPSVREPGGRTQTLVRQLWVPLFDEHGLRLAFENHDHAYKRTHPLRGGEIAPDGLVYAGDGAWGVGVRDLAVGRPYLARAEKRNYALLVTLRPGQADLEAVSPSGEVFDAYTVPARSPRP